MGGFRCGIVLGRAVGENGLHARFMVLEAINDLVKILGVISEHSGQSRLPVRENAAKCRRRSVTSLLRLEREREKVCLPHK